MEIVAEVRAMVWEWTKHKGPVSGWPSGLMAKYKYANANDTLQELEVEFKSHRDVSLALVKTLHGFAGSRLPQDEHELRDIIRQVFDLTTTLLAGISIIDTHLALVSTKM